MEHHANTSLEEGEILPLQPLESDWHQWQTWSAHPAFPRVDDEYEDESEDDDEEEEADEEGMYGRNAMAAAHAADVMAMLDARRRGSEAAAGIDDLGGHGHHGHHGGDDEDDDEDDEDDEDELTTTDPRSRDVSRSLEDIFRCFICLGRVTNAHLCPACSKLCCLDCIRRWLTEQRSQCPHCRSPLRVTQLVPCRFVAEVSTELDKLSKTGSAGKLNRVCKEHGAELYYYCKDCATSICSDCAMFGEAHRGHSFEHLSKVYERHVEAIQSGLGRLEGKLKDLNGAMKQVEANVGLVTKSRDECVGEMRSAVEAMEAKLDGQLKAKLLTLLAQKSSMANEIDRIETVVRQVNRELERCPRHALIHRSPDIVQLLDEHQAIAVPETVSEVSTGFDSEVVPPYESAVLEMTEYSKTREVADVVYSEPLFASGATWRLKVYPDGNGVARGTYLSVFLELTSGYPALSKYEYRIEMLNKSCPSECIVREFASDFEVGECWGYNRFYRIDYAGREGYLANDSISLRFSIRAPTFHLQARDLKNHITSVHMQKQSLEAQLQETTRRLKAETSRRKALEAMQRMASVADADEHGAKDEDDDDAAELQPDAAAPPAAVAARGAGSPPCKEGEGEADREEGGGSAEQELPPPV